MLEDFSKAERKVIFLATFLFMLLGYFLVNDELLDFENFTNTQSIGKIAESENDVRFKRKQKFVWKTAKEQLKVGEGDSIFTGENSFANVLLDDGTEVVVEPNSLIVFQRNADKLQLDLKFGQIQSSLPLQVKLPCDVMDIKGANTKVKLNSDCTVQSLGGEIKHSSKKITSSDTIADLEWLEKPGEKFFHSNRNVSMNFAWKRQRKISKYNLEFSKDEKFLTENSKSSTEKSRLISNSYPQSGILYYRLKGLDTSGKTIAQSKIEKTQIYDIPPPVIKKPLPLEKFLSIKDPDGTVLEPVEVLTDWTFTYPSYTFDVQISKVDSASENQNLLTNFSARGLSLVIKNLSAGEYQVKVRATDINNQVHTDWSEKVTFFVDQKQMRDLSAPLLLTKNLRTDFGKNEQAIARWRAVDGAAKYRLEISSTEDFQEKTMQEVNNTTIPIPNPTEPGIRHFRLSALTQKGTVGPSSEVGTLFSFADRPVLNPSQNVSKLGKSPDDPGDPVPVPTSWTPTPNATEYQLEVSTDPSFTNSTKVLSKEPVTNFVAEKPGDYYYRVQALNSERKPASDVSEIQKFNYFLEVPLYTPLVSEPINNSTIYFQRQTAANIWIQWNAIKSAEVYHLEIASDENFSKIVYKNQVSTNRYLLKRRLSEGSYFYRIKAQNSAGKVSNWSETRRFKIFLGKTAGGQL